MKSGGNSTPSTSLSGRLALVTGGGRGIGAATAAELLARGAQVFICARTASEISATVARLGEAHGKDAIRGGAFDLADAAAIPAVFDEAERAFGGEKVRILVNNAALGYAIPFLETAPEKLREEWDRMQAVNVRAPLLLSHELMRRIPRGEARDPRAGAIVNLGSLGGIRATEKFPGLAPYVATKFAIAGLTEALAVEGRALGVRVNAVAPGAVDTEMLRKAAPHLKTETRPMDVAKVIAYLCDAAESGSLSGTVIEIHSNL
jgi:3-oxoacyl-[acyl-carrier protein] reductase